jgi:CBS domain-containing protein
MMEQRRRTVRDFMSTDVHILAPDAPIQDAVDFLISYGISGAPVVDEGGRMVGIISEMDCLKLLAKGHDHGPPDGTVAYFMTREVRTVPSHMDIYFVAGMFLSNPYRRFPVVDGERLVGVISRHDVLKAIQSLR